MSKPDFPRSILAFQEWFVDEQACLDYLFESRWPEGFTCPRCGGRDAYPIATRRLWQCVQCRYQVSVTAGTVMHKTRLSLRLWFWAAYLVATGTPGLSARQLQRQLALTRYDTAWTMLHKLRRAMVAPDRGLLSGEVEVDEFEIGGVEKGRSGGRSGVAKASTGIIAVEVRGTGSGRIRIELIDDATAATLSGFIERTVEAGAIVHTDGWQGYAKLTSMGYVHRRRSQAKAKRDGDTDPVLPRAHRAISNFKSWLRGTHRGVSAEHLQVYLDEFIFRYNRRRTPMAAFQTLLGLSSHHPPSTRAEIVAEGPAAAKRS
ncbi:IS1595 family transposase [Cryobacterium sp. 10S3]|uniref:IS1595 family transposase n=1 Tax=Cryobacterium sp. 10S3 TaxID=3048582 RepID=UPI002AC8F50D|nr:IS1595 family transposase [Cryobacterium sp. 10S3]MEB0288796.1 IS1595 family transposase [Cryobacterium sp. 10S3]WPX12153.1 IS1595 family transposase [Cryobacterium sp. 10S3]WPX13196.1 IS1595 family transposase [Cryobacterium sp. 10S3]